LYRKEAFLMTPLGCGCVIVGGSVAFNLCREGHSEKNPPQFRPDQSRAEAAAVPAPRSNGAPRPLRHRWNPATGELEDIP
jgi:hypothetical protein